MNQTGYENPLLIIFFEPKLELNWNAELELY